MSWRNRIGIRLGDRGVAAIEFAFVLPVLLLISFGIIDYGRSIWSQTTLDYAAQATARCAAIGSCTGTLSDAQDRAWGITVSSISAAPTTSACGATATPPAPAEKVVLTSQFYYIFPAFSAYSGPLTATACFPK